MNRFPKCTTSSGQPLKDNAPLRIVGNVNVPPRKTEEELVPPPMVEGMTQVMGNWERLIEHHVETAKALMPTMLVQEHKDKIITHTVHEVLTWFG